MADVTLNPDANNKELFGQGIRAFILQDYETAVRAFSKSSELLVEEYGDELHDSLGDVYCYYGKSLLELSRKEGGALGEGVLKNVEEESEEETEEPEGEENNEEAQTEETAENKADASDDTNKTDDAKTEEAELAAVAKTDEDKEAEKTDESTEEATAEADVSGDKKEGEAEEELTDLQVAWEVLELAKRIFTKRGDDGRKNLAETLISLGEVSLESGNFAAAIEDISEGLRIQKTLFGNDSRTIAETCYKLGGAYSTNGQIDEAIESFSTSKEYLHNRVNTLQKEGEDKNAEEIKELNNLIPEIDEKIADMKSLKTEIANKLTAEAAEAAPKVNGTSEASTSKQVNNISHLVKRKRKEEEAAPEENPAKRPSP